MNGMVEKQMRASILSIGSFWFSAWVDAGQPTLKNLIKTEIDPEERKLMEKTEQKYKEGSIIGREN